RENLIRKKWKLLRKKRKLLRIASRRSNAGISGSMINRPDCHPLVERPDCGFDLASLIVRQAAAIALFKQERPHLLAGGVERELSRFVAWVVVADRRGRAGCPCSHRIGRTPQSIRLVVNQ